MTDQDPVVDAYDRWAATYDTDDNRTRDLDADVVRGWLPRLRARDVLEFGCGTGKNTAAVAPVARSLTSVDVSAAMLERARARPGVKTVQFVLLGRDEDWPVEDGSLDVVMANLVLEHLPDVTPFLQQASRALRPGGWVLVSELHPERQRRGSRARGAADADDAPPCFLHPMSEYVAAARAASLVIEALEEPLEPDAAPDAPPRLAVWHLRRPA